MKPYAKAQTIKLDGLLDRRRVLTDKQKAEIRELYAKGGIGTRRIAAMYGCSRSLVCIIVNPERARRVRERFAEHWKEYSQKYGKNERARAMRNWRNYKYRLFKEGVIGKITDQKMKEKRGTK